MLHTVEWCMLHVLWRDKIKKHAHHTKYSSLYVYINLPVWITGIDVTYCSRKLLQMPHASSKSLHSHLRQLALICLDSSILCVECHFITTVFCRIWIIIAFIYVTLFSTSVLQLKQQSKTDRIVKSGREQTMREQAGEMNWTNSEKYYTEYIWIQIYFCNISAKRQDIGYAGEGYTWTMWIAEVWTRKDKSIEFFSFEIKELKMIVFWPQLERAWSKKVKSNTA